MSQTSGFLEATASSLAKPIKAFDNFFKINGDHRVSDLAFMNNPWGVMFISAFYVYFCYDLGPHRIMKNRPAFDLVWTVRVFNTVILMLNAWLLYKFTSLWGISSFGCSHVDFDENSPVAMEKIEVCHIFLLSKLLELIDTLWICLRKKNRQITFLHVFHHSFVLLMTWYYFKLAPGGSSVMFPMVNGTVHTIMYVYYIMSTFEPLKKYLWWKKYVTKIQLLQFVILGVHFAVAALTPNCQYPRILSLSGLFIAGLFFSLFIGFYRQTYTASQRYISKKELEKRELLESNGSYEDGDKNNNNTFDSLIYQLKLSSKCR